MSDAVRRTEETTVGQKHSKGKDDHGSVTTDDLLDTSPFDGDLAAELAARPPRRIRPGMTTYLGVGVLVIVGFLGGMQAQKQWGAEPAGPNTGALQQAPASGRVGGPGGGRGQGIPDGGQQGGAGAGNVTFGTVKLVDGKTIYLQTASGEVVHVTTDGSTKVQISQAGTVKDLKPGATVTVQGSQGQDGAVAATSVSEGGSPTGRGLFGGGGGGGN
jgi:hypothetical protein